MHGRHLLAEDPTSVGGYRHLTLEEQIVDLEQQVCSLSREADISARECVALRATISQWGQVHELDLKKLKDEYVAELRKLLDQVAILKYYNAKFKADSRRLRRAREKAIPKTSTSRHCGVPTHLL